MSRKKAPAIRREEVTEEIEAHLYQGPIPAPQTLAAFNEIIPNGADRIMQMAEKEQAHEHDTQAKIIETRDAASKREHTEILVGQICAFILCASALGGGVYLMSINHMISGGLLSGAALAGVLKTLITRGK